MKNVFLTVFILLFLGISIFLIWYFFFNIFEVKYFTNIERNNLKSNKEIKIKYYGINSFGQKLNFREIPVNFKIVEGKKLIEKIDSSNQNQISFFTKSSNGIIKIQFDSKYSLNPSVFTFLISN